MRRNCSKFILIGINFLQEIFYKKTLYFLLFLLEFDLFIDFQSSDIVHTQNGSTLDVCMIFGNDDWTLLHGFFLPSTLRKCIAHTSFFLCRKTDSIEI